MSGAGPRVHVRPEAVSGTRVVLDAEEARHLRRVLRLRVGDLVRALDGRGRELTVRLTALGARSAEGEILESATPARESPLHLTLAQGLPKGDKLETIIRMSTELGVAAVVPLLTSRTVSVGEGRGRLARWERVAREAAKQSGRAPSNLTRTLSKLQDAGLVKMQADKRNRVPIATVKTLRLTIDPFSQTDDLEMA